MSEILRYVSFDGAFFRTVLTMSLTGSVLALALFLVKPLIKDRLPKAAQTCLWLVVIAALTVPVSTFVLLPDSGAAIVPTAPIQGLVKQIIVTSEEELDDLASQIPLDVRDEAETENRWISVSASVKSLATSVFIFAYPFGVLLVLLYFIVKNAVLLHERPRPRRKDAVVQWLSVLAGAVHWFNPIVWLVRREIKRACELSCDEAVIRELGAIKQSKRSARLAMFMSAVLLFAVSGAAIALGAGEAPAGYAGYRPLVTLYAYDQKHITHRLHRAADTGLTTLADEIFIDVKMPEGSVSLQIYCSEPGGETDALNLGGAKITAPQKSPDRPASALNGRTWRASADYPSGFRGQIWAVTTDADGREHYSGRIDVVWEPAAPRVGSLSEGIR